jgi:hypothetical protein
MPDLALNPLPLQNPEGGALNLTRLSGIGGAIVALLTTVNGSWNAIFGAHTPNWAKPVFLAVVVIAWAAIACADLLGRGYVAAHRALAAAQIIPLAGIRATYTKAPTNAASSRPRE